MPLDSSKLTKDSPRPVSWNDSKTTIYASVALLLVVVVLAIIRLTRKRDPPTCKPTHPPLPLGPLILTQFACCCAMAWL
jgi:hypothetical protein